MWLRGNNAVSLTIAATLFISIAICKTEFTGDIVNGIEVISNLDISDIPSRKVSHYYLRAAELNGGLPLHIPVIVARGTEESLTTGKKLSVLSAPGTA